MASSRSLHGPSYFPNYYSLEDILATNEKLPCKFEKTVVGMGYLDSSGRSKDLEKGTKLELPLWLAAALGPRRKLVTCHLPRAFNERYREILRADATIVDLQGLAPYFYEFGRHLLPLVGAEGVTLGQLLTETLKQRLRRVMDSSLHCLEDDAAVHKARFDHLERTLFHTGRRMYQDHQLWLARRCHIITSIASTEQSGKRKLSEIS
ncbi:DNA replication complex GINS protein PSF3-like [Scylla paramamosain]